VHTEAFHPSLTLTLKRNCSISPSSLLVLLGAMMLVSLGIGVAFAVAGAWMVLPFAGVEMVALAAAFYLHGRHAGDYERLALSTQDLVVEVREGEKTRRASLNPAWVQLAERDSVRDYRLALVAHGREIEIGRHLDDPRRRDLADKLRSALQVRVGTKAEGWEKR
jgi:uncharacterized membrane protein